MDFFLHFSFCFVSLLVSAFALSFFLAKSCLSRKKKIKIHTFYSSPNQSLIASSVCSPRNGGGVEAKVFERDILIGFPTIFTSKKGQKEAIIRRGKSGINLKGFIWEGEEKRKNKPEGGFEGSELGTSIFTIISCRR